MATTPRTFISFDFDHNADHKLLFAGQAKNSRVPFSIADWSSKAALPQATWEEQISNKISRCELMIVLVGKKTAIASGVKKELQFAAAHRIPVFGVYVDGADYTTSLPAGLPRTHVIEWNWDRIAQAIKALIGG
ncbi:MAG: TIR domain-containing protein [Bdellovibrionales bacterium]